MSIYSQFWKCILSIVQIVCVFTPITIDMYRIYIETGNPEFGSSRYQKAGTVIEIATVEIPITKNIIV